MINKLMSNNYKNEGFGMQKFEDNLSKVSAKLAKVLTQSLAIFTQSLYLLAHSIKKSVQSTIVLPYSIDELNQ
jgi:hypothetical protein